MGVFLVIFCSRLPGFCLPHARGGVSIYGHHTLGPVRSSPRPGGCFHHAGLAIAHLHVFPTPVGVFPDGRAARRVRSGLPHARGGVSASRVRCRIWSGLPHARGGVSPTPTRSRPWPRSSPRPWGCFLKRLTALTACLVFPTPVGVFLFAARAAAALACLPHARGGVSNRGERVDMVAWSSPRPWGCFQCFQYY